MSTSKNVTSRRWLIGALGAAVVAFVLGVVGLAQFGPQPHRPSDVVYNALQLFVLGSDPLGGGGPLPWELEVARILAPATTVAALFETLRTLWREERERRGVARQKGHSIVCGSDTVSRELARNLATSGVSVVRVEPGTGGVTVDRDGVAVVRGDAREQTTLEAAGIRGAATVYACAADSGDNAAVALAAARLRQQHEPRPTTQRRRPGPPQPSTRLSVFAQVADDDLVQALRVRQLGADRRRGASLDFFSVEDIAARILVAKPDVVTAVKLALVGSGVVATALLRALVRTPPTTAGPRIANVHTDDADEIDQLAVRFRAAERGTRLRAVAADAAIEAGTGLVIVCQPDDETTLGTALRLQRSPGYDVIACLRRADPFDETLAGTERLSVFGVLDAACQEKAVADDAILGRAARAIHLNYVERCREAGDTPASNSSMRDWEDLASYLRESNYAQAEHIGAKLAELPAVLTTVAPAQPFVFDDAEVLMLAKLEHQRWMDERRAAGFTVGPVRDNAHHPDLVDWPNLPPDSRAKDLQATRQLPVLLGAAGLYIARLR